MGKKNIFPFKILMTIYIGIMSFINYIYDNLISNYLLIYLLMIIIILILIKILNNSSCNL
jgi:hypothetical protein